MSREEPSPQDPNACLKEGLIIAKRCRLEKLIGQGGMGVVWEARDQLEADQPCALKFLGSEFFADQIAIAELIGELELCRQFEHPSIIRVHGLLKDLDLRRVAVQMELGSGGNLAQRRQKRPYGRFEPTEIAEWVRQLCLALDYAHSKGVVHRDLKPTNLLLDHQDWLKLADFGIARVYNEASARRSGTHAVSGTPAYGSPQQFRGLPALPGDDFYALGATLYDLLTGRPPFRGPPPAVLQQLLDPSILPPSVAERREELGQPPGSIPPEWEDVIARLLAKEAKDRPQTAREVLHALKIPGGTTTNAPAGPTPPGKAKSKSSLATQKPRKTGRLVAVTASICLAMGTGYSWWRRVSADVTPAQSSPDGRIPVTGYPLRLRIGSRVNSVTKDLLPPFGFIDGNQHIKIDLKWENAGKFSEGFAAVAETVAQEKRWGFIDCDGRISVKTTWNEVKPFSEGLAAVKGPDSWGFIDTSGQTLSPPQWQRADSFTASLAPVKKDSLWGYVNITGAYLVKPTYSNAYPAFEKQPLAVERNPLGWTFIDVSGNPLSFSTWDNASSFSEGRARVQKAGKWGFIDLTGALKIPLQWEDVARFSDGLAAFKQDRKWGAIDADGQVIFKPRWDEAFEFQEGLAAVRLNGKWGFIDRNGDPKIPIEWDHVDWQATEGGKRVYRLLIKQISGDEALAKWIDPELRVVWTATLPL